MLRDWRGIFIESECLEPPEWPSDEGAVHHSGAVFCKQMASKNNRARRLVLSFLLFPIEEAEKDLRRALLWTLPIISLVR